MILSFLNIHKVPWEVLKTKGKALRLQHFPQDFANVYEWKILFDPSINLLIMAYYLSGVSKSVCLVAKVKPLVAKP